MSRDIIVHFIAPKERSKWYSHKFVYRGGKKLAKPQLLHIWEICYRTWLKSSFKTKLINDTTDIDNLLNNYESAEFIELLNSLPLIYKIDYVKCLIMAKIGGGFADMDIYLNVDFKKLINPNKIYIMGSGETNLQSSMMFSPKDIYWENLTYVMKTNMFQNREDILESVRLYSNKRKNKDEELKDQYLAVHSRTVGGDVMKQCMEEYDGKREIIVFPDEYFNGSQYNPLPFTTHYCTGIWRRKGRIFGAYGAEVLKDFLKKVPESPTT